MYAGPGLLPLGEERWGLAYAANWHNHNEYGALLQSHRPAPDGEFWWAKWKRDRLVAVEAPTLGHFSVSQRPCAGKQLLVNCQTERGGWLQFELLDGTYNRKNVEAGPAYAGYSFADCDPLRGDLLAHEVTWRGKSDLSGFAGKSVLMRVKMARAKLFALAI
jgi:hypothetical protein